MHPTTRRSLIAYAGLVLAALFWAGNAVIARGVTETIRPFSLAFGRWALALAILVPMGLPHVRRGRAIIRANLWPLFWLGLLSVGAYNTLLYIAARTTTALNITLLGSTLPIAIAVLARVVLQQRTTPRQVVGFLAAAAGTVIIVTRGEWRVLADFAFRAGDLLMIAAVVLWGLYSVLLRVWKLDLHPIGFITVTTTVGVALLLPPYLWEVATFGAFDVEPGHLPLFAYLAIFPSILAFLFWNRGIAELGPNATGMFIYLMPVFTAGLAYAILGEALLIYHLCGGLFILAGLTLATWPTRAAQHAPVLPIPKT